ncbi:hypothetical protein Gogos_002873 [Gossypium gossypioides]|uniref:Uncharacterized protein n=1 Tax=Gossypium gossypioides TaxID=34282 RepID=A0A7J9CL57_GOSGO|nr:hypothetical protein [Gossypium gossypioides]
MENQEQGRRTFSKPLTPIEVVKRIILFFYTVVAEFFEFEEGRQYFMDVTDSLRKVDICWHISCQQYCRKLCFYKLGIIFT